MNKYCVLLLVVALPLSAADVVLAGRLEIARRASISIRTAGGGAGNVSVEYKNHRRFEVAASIAFGKDQ